MAISQDVQTQIHEEIDQVLRDQKPSLSDVSSMSFLKASIAEAQRIRSVVPLGIPHGASNEIEINGYTVPKGAMIVPLQWAIHMNPLLWKDPEVFDPRRFINEEGRFVRPENFIPFQTGENYVCCYVMFRKQILFLVSNKKKTWPNPVFPKSSSLWPTNLI